MRNAPLYAGYSWPTLLFTFAGVVLACYAIARACDAPLRVWEDEHDA